MESEIFSTEAEEVAVEWAEVPIEVFSDFLGLGGKEGYDVWMEFVVVGLLSCECGNLGCIPFKVAEAAFYDAMMRSSIN